MGLEAVAYPEIFRGGVLARNFFRGGVQQIQLRPEGRENRDLGAVAPSSGVPLNLQMSETRILIRLLQIYFPRISEFGPASEFREGGFNPPNPPSVHHCLEAMFSKLFWNRKQRNQICCAQEEHFSRILYYLYF
jgi:hypothetical protein